MCSAIEACILEVKKRLLKCYIWSVLTYGCESWTISNVMEEKFAAAEMWFYRRMLRVSWKEVVTNEDILNRMRTKRLLVDTIRGRQWKFIGHILREEDRIERHIIETPMEGKRTRGRQRITFLDWMRKRANAQDGTELGEMARDRDGWRRMKPP